MMIEYVNGPALVKMIEDAHCYGFDDVYERYKQEYGLEDVAPVIHAHWKPSILPLLQIDWFRCSNCNANAIQTPFDIPAKTEFCPFCGAKMDEVINDET